MEAIELIKLKKNGSKSIKTLKNSGSSYNQTQSKQMDNLCPLMDCSQMLDDEIEAAKME